MNCIVQGTSKQVSTRVQEYKYIYNIIYYIKYKIYILYHSVLLKIKCTVLVSKIEFILVLFITYAINIVIFSNIQ